MTRKERKKQGLMASVLFALTVGYLVACVLLVEAAKAQPLGQQDTNFLSVGFAYDMYVNSTDDDRAAAAYGIVQAILAGGMSRAMEECRDRKGEIDSSCAAKRQEAFIGYLSHFAARVNNVERATNEQAAFAFLHYCVESEVDSRAPLHVAVAVFVEKIIANYEVKT